MQIKNVTPQNYKEDPLYRRVVNAVRHLQQTKGEITPINVLLTLGMLPSEKLREWQQGRIPFLEAVLKSNLSKTNRVLRILRLHAADLQMRIVSKEYYREGAGPRRVLQFSRAKEINIENAYARVYVQTESTPQPPGASSTRQPE